jgi:hypothetical protein
VQNVSYRGFHTDLKAWKCRAVSGYPQAVPERGMHDIVRVKYSCMEDSRIFLMPEKGKVSRRKLQAVSE